MQYYSSCQGNNQHGDNAMQDTITTLSATTPESIEFIRQLTCFEEIIDHALTMKFGRGRTFSSKTPAGACESAMNDCYRIALELRGRRLGEHVRIPKRQMLPYIKETLAHFEGLEIDGRRVNPTYDQSTAIMTKIVRL